MVFNFDTLFSIQAREENKAYNNHSTTPYFEHMQFRARIFVTNYIFFS